MKKFLLGLFATLLTCCTQHATIVSPHHTAKDLTFIPMLDDMTIALTHKDEDGDHTPYCAGVWIDGSKIITAEHCVDKFGRAQLGISKDTSFDATGTKIEYVIKSDVDLSAPNNWPKTVRSGVVIAIDNKNDLALINTNETKHHSHATIVHREAIAAGMHLNIVGHTIGLWWTYFDGCISTTWKNIKSPNKNRANVIQVSSPTWFGNSGGGAFDDDGNLVGIASWIITDAPNISFYTHRDEIVRFIDESNRDQHIDVMTPTKHVPK